MKEFVRVHSISVNLKPTETIHLMISKSTHEEFIEELVSSVNKLIPSLLHVSSSHF